MQPMIWNADPVMVTLGPVAIHWYGLLFAAALLFGLRLVRAMALRDGLPTAELEPAFLYIAAGVLIGARLVHCLVYDPAYYLAHPLEIPLLWKGGLASHGGLLGALAAIFLFVRRHPRWNLWWMLDRVAVASALGGAFVRLGNFANSEIVGVPASVPWAVVFARVDGIPRHPVQLYESLAYATIFLVLYTVSRSERHRDRQGLLFGGFLCLVFLSRLLLESFKVPQASYEQGAAVSVGQWLSIPFILAGTALVVRALRRPAHQD